MAASMLDWTTEEVLHGLRGLPWVDAWILQKVAEHDIDGTSLVELTKDDLKDEFALRTLGRVKRTLHGIRTLALGNGVDAADIGGPPPPQWCRACGPDGGDGAASPPHDACDDSGSSCDATSQGSVGHDAPSPTVRPAAPSPPAAATAEMPADEASAPPSPGSGGGSGGGGGDVGEAAERAGVDVDISRDDLRSEGAAAAAAAAAEEKENEKEAAHRAPVRRPVPPANRADTCRRPSTAMAERGSDAVQRLADEQQRMLKEADVGGGGGVRLPQAPPPRGLEGDASIRRPASAEPEGARRWFPMGILEAERRYAGLSEAFAGWVACSEGGAVSLQSVLQTLRDYFGWSGGDVLDVREQVRAVLPALCRQRGVTGSIDYAAERVGTPGAFVSVVGIVSDGMSPHDFDHLHAYLKSCIKRSSQQHEENRRLGLAAQLFAKWDYDGSGELSEEEFGSVVRRFNEVTLELDSAEDQACFDMARQDANADGVLDRTEFQTMLLAAWGGCDAKLFDLKYFRLSCAVEDLVLSKLAGRAGIGADSLADVVAAATPATPVILYGLGGADPSRAVEEAAASFSCEVRPVLVTHRDSEHEALKVLTRHGFGRGCWVYIVVGQGYDPERLFRELGRALHTTNTWMLHRNFRLLVSYPARSVASLPSILAMRSLQIDAVHFNPQEAASQMASVQGMWRAEHSSTRVRATSHQPWHA